MTSFKFLMHHVIRLKIIFLYCGTFIWFNISWNNVQQPNKYPTFISNEIILLVTKKLVQVYYVCKESHLPNLQTVSLYKYSLKIGIQIRNKFENNSSVPVSWNLFSIYRIIIIIKIRFMKMMILFGKQSDSFITTVYSSKIKILFSKVSLISEFIDFHFSHKSSNVVTSNCFIMFVMSL